ncbi:MULTISPECIES: hypothetical protein [unclassified Providencia]|uniref:hypothetical protein n=1 Tax=unclassified Providencia TaxID=2633465 RepID=UPI00234AA107|nr:MULTISPECIES: hypothetical protein [unclassified Providencia]
MLTLPTKNNPKTRLKAVLLMGLIISPAVILVCTDISWDGLLFLAIYTGLSAWVTQILNNDSQQK